MSNKITGASKSYKVLAEWLKDFSLAAAEGLDAFLLSAGSVRSLARRSGLNSRQYSSTFYNLKKCGYIERTNENQFLITPKAVKEIRLIEAEESDWAQKMWDGYWRIVVFDIPESRRRERNAFRSFLKRKGLLGFRIASLLRLMPILNF